MDTPDLPNLAGQDPLYTYKQLQDYKSESRPSFIMGEVVKTLSDRDMADLAAFYAAQAPAPAPLLRRRRWRRASRGSSRSATDGA